MIPYYLKSALRSFFKNKTSSIINLVGLTIGLTIVITFFVLVRYELSFDSFHENADRIYRIVKGNAADKESYAGTPPTLGDFIKDNIPEVEDFTRLHKAELVVKYGDNQFTEKEFFFADPSFFEIFTFPLSKGNASTALQNPGSIVITKTAATKYFGSDNPVGKILTVGENNNFTVTAVAEDVPDNSHFHFDFIIPFKRLDDVLKSNQLESWGSWNFYTYILTGKNVNTNLLQSKITNLFNTKLPELAQFFEDITYQPVKDIHFQYNRKNIEPAFDDKYISIYIAIAIAVLLIACINFINLTTANSMQRAKEVGLRKTIGANYSELLKQFLLESILFVVIAAMLAVVLVEVILPVVNSITAKHYSLDYTNYCNYLILLGLVLLTGILAGGYPAVVLSSFQPVKALKGKLNENSNSVFRNALVVFQFSISIALIVCTFIIFQQINFIQNKNLGFAKDQIINIPLQTREMMKKAPVIKEEFLRNRNIISASANSYLPSNFNEHWGGFKWDGMSDQEENNEMWILKADKDFIKTYQVKMLEGNDYSVNFEATDQASFILNKSALKLMNWKTALGKELTYWETYKGRIVGVMDDFNFRSLHHQIEPCAILLNEYGRHISIRLKAENISSSLADIKKSWESFNTNLPFEYHFLDDDFAKLYQSEIRTSKIIGNFSLITVFIACIGLFGLTSFMAERRRKELGIRKVLGASEAGLLRLFSFDYTKWVILANLIAWPAAYYFMSYWLEDFAYRIDITIYPFLLAGFSALAIALLTISWRALKAARVNPVESLRYE